MITAVPGDLPSPTTAVWYLGPLPIRAYALCILAGIIAAVWITGRRLARRGGTAGQALDVAAWAVPFGIVGGRLYHLLTTPQPYFGPGGNPADALRIWTGGLGIWGAVALGALGAWIGCRRNGVDFAQFADALAPGLLVAQAIGRFGNWFNNEIYGSPTTLPWGLVVHEWDPAAGRAVVDSSGVPVVLGVVHPTFLYESLWCLGLALALVLVERRRQLRPGQLFALYVMGYPLGRVFIELLRTDEANLLFGVRVNVWTSALVFVLGLLLYRRAAGVPEPQRPPVPR